MRYFMFHEQEGASEGTTNNRAKSGYAKTIPEKVILSQKILLWY